MHPNEIQNTFQFSKLPLEETYAMRINENRGYFNFLNEIFSLVNNRIKHRTKSMWTDVGLQKHQRPNKIAYARDELRVLLPPMRPS